MLTKKLNRKFNEKRLNILGKHFEPLFKILSHYHSKGEIEEKKLNMKNLNTNWQSRLVMTAVSFMFMFGACNSTLLTASSPSETIRNWNSFMEKNNVSDAHALFAKDATAVDSTLNKSEVKGEVLKNQLAAMAGEFKKYQDAGKPLPKFEIINEKTSGEQTSVFVAYNFANNSGRKRIDFFLVKENGGWKIQKMDGFGFTFQ